MSETILRLENVAVGYGSTKIVSSINAVVSENELVAVLGKNGVGKSTLINTILGFQKTLLGNIFLGDKLLKKLSAQDIAKEIAVVLPRLSFVPRIKVSELVDIGRLPYHTVLKKKSVEEQELIDEVFCLVGIEELKNKYATEISEGQLQLVMIARALCQDAKLIILDEPTSNLDLANQYKVFHLLNDLKLKTNKSFLMITHEINLALENADKVWWMEQQKLVEGIPEQLALDHKIIQKLSNNNLFYNKDYNAFVVPQHHTKSISINGNSELAYWVKNAFTRNGFLLENNVENCIEITENSIIFGGEKFENIQAIITFIQQYEKYNHNRSE